LIVPARGDAFQSRDIHSRKVYGAYIFTERRSEGITLGATKLLYRCGFKYDVPQKPYHMDGFVNSPGAVQGLEFYSAL
jgi:multiple sugar transport system substrate-binding protein